MHSIVSVILPVFALIAVGWVARKLGLLGPQATHELNRFVVYLALPALLFDIIGNASLADLWQPRFIVVFGLSSLVVFIAVLLVGLCSAVALGDASIDALNASYPNTGFMGFPLALSIFGASSLPLALIATILIVAVVFGVAIVLIEVAMHEGRPLRRVLGRVFVSVLRNPLVAAPAVAFLFQLTRWAMPTPAQSVLKLLGAAASPCALITLGLFLAEKRTRGQGIGRRASLLVVMKLLIQPALAASLSFALKLPTAVAGTAVLLAALPTGTGPFMLATLYQREAQVTSWTILASTIGSIVTIAAYLKWMGW